ncbi:MAG: hypothetical protein ABEN55_00930 [Bradymonadaceae bacterium]
MKRTESLAVVASTIALLAVTMLPMPSRAEILGGTEAEQTAESSETWPKLGLGVRLGGHGFRHVRDERISWEDCRMNGAGLFATLDFTNQFFGELSMDYYHATGSTVASGMDRVSVYVLGAAGARLLPDFIVSPYLQVGIGPEWTRIEVGDHLEATVLAAPFIGVPETRSARPKLPDGPPRPSGRHRGARRRGRAPGALRDGRAGAVFRPMGVLRRHSPDPRERFLPSDQRLASG